MQGGGETREQAELIKTVTNWLPSFLILFKLSHLPTLNGKLSQLLPVSLWGQWPEEWGERVNAAGLHPSLGPGGGTFPTWGERGSHRGGCHLPFCVWEMSPRQTGAGHLGRSQLCSAGLGGG